MEVEITYAVSPDAFESELTPSELKNYNLNRKSAFRWCDSGPGHRLSLLSAAPSY
jgi:hypothetical protein